MRATAAAELPAERRHDERDAMRGSQAVWSLLDQKGTQTMMKSVLGEAAGWRTTTP